MSEAEDKALTDRIVREPERALHHVDVGNVTDAEAGAKIKERVAEIKERLNPRECAAVAFGAECEAKALSRKVIDLFNRLRALDPDGFEAVVRNRVTIGTALGSDPELISGTGNDSLSALGLLNSAIKAMGGWPVAAKLDESNKVIGFCHWAPPAADGTPGHVAP